MPLVVFWTLSDVDNGEQLLLDYGQGYWDSKPINEKKEKERVKQKVELAEKEKAAHDLTQTVAQQEQQIKEHKETEGDQSKKILEMNKELKAKKAKLQQAEEARQRAAESAKEKEEEGRRHKEQ